MKAKRKAEVKTIHDLLPAERRILNLCPPASTPPINGDPDTKPAGLTAAAVADTLKIHYNYACSCLNNLFNIDLVTYEVHKRRRYWHKTNRPTPPTSTTIQPSTSIDTTLHNLTIMAQDCAKYQQALHAIANILLEAGIVLPEIKEPAEITQ